MSHKFNFKTNMWNTKNLIIISKDKWNKAYLDLERDLLLLRDLDLDLLRGDLDLDRLRDRDLERFLLSL